MIKTFVESAIVSFAQIELYLSDAFNEIRPDANTITHNNKRFPNLTLNLRSRQVYCGSHDKFLAPFRFALLRLLVESPNGIVTFDETCDDVSANALQTKSDAERPHFTIVATNVLSRRS